MIVLTCTIHVNVNVIVIDGPIFYGDKKHCKRFNVLTVVGIIMFFSPEDVDYVSPTSLYALKTQKNTNIVRVFIPRYVTLTMK